jgi:hypothetical protein
VRQTSHWTRDRAERPGERGRPSLEIAADDGRAIEQADDERQEGPPNIGGSVVV